jgi:hypothetical protein
VKQAWTAHAGLGGVVAAMAVVLACGCGPSPITAARIEGAMAPTFANLVHLQLARVGLPPVPASDITVAAACHKSGDPRAAAGSGDWVCTLDWAGPNRLALRDTYDLSVSADGCFTATVDSDQAHLGGPTLRASDGGTIRNLLYAFEGCFDTAGRR